jgi:5'-deoxynucleotidase YfbR-like HD superfamily hydrolase
VVRDADKLEMIHQALRYEAHGQRKLDEFWQPVSWCFPASAALFRQLSLHRIARYGEGSAHEQA